MQELSKKQQQLEQAHSMLLRHHEKTQDLEYRQQKSVHALREDQVCVQSIKKIFLILIKNYFFRFVSNTKAN